MTAPAYDRAFWERLWSEILSERAEHVAARPPSAYVAADLADLPSGEALDAGCGHGAEALLLAARGWNVTAVDFSASALAHGRATAEAAGPRLAGRIEWVEADLGTWAPAPARYDLVLSLYVHMAGGVEAAVARLAAGVAPRGTLFLVGHRPVDPATGARTAAAGQVQVSLAAAGAALGAEAWELVVAEERRRPAGGVDAVVRARRRR